MAAALLFGSGILLGGRFPALPAPATIGFSLAFSAACALCARRAAHLASAGVLAGFLLLGVGLATLRAEVRAAPDGSEALLEGRVVEPFSKDGVTRFVLRTEAASGAGGWRPVRYSVRITAPGAPILLPEDRVRIRADLHPLAPPANPGAPDLLPRARAEGVVATGVVRDGQLAVLGSGSRLPRRVAALRRGFGALVDSACGEGEAGALVRALGMGERATLGDAINEDFNLSGLAHVLSVSGLHVAVVALALQRFLRWLLARSERLLLGGQVRRWSSFAAIAATWAYVVLTGSEVPAVRSAIMASALFAASALDRDPDAPSSLAAALLAVLGFDPAALHAVSFQLSFAAVAGLMLLTGPLRDLVPVPKPDRTEGGLRGLMLRGREAVLLAASGSLAASLATAPLLAVTFHRASIIAVLSNAVALPVASALTVLSAAAAMLYPLADELAVGPLLFAEPLSRLLLGISHAFAAFPLASAHLAAPSLASSLAWYLLVAALAARPLRPALARRIALPAAAVLALLWARRALLPLLSGSLTVTFLAVGQGDAVLVQLPRGKAILVDGGGDPGGRWDVGGRVVVPALLDLGVTRLEAVVVSHPHPDHALGLQAVLGALPVRELWLPAAQAHEESLADLRGLARSLGVQERLLAAGAPGQDDRFAPAKVQVLHPPAGLDDLSGNDASLALRLELGAISFLLPGDLEEEGERRLLEGLPRGVTVLKAPHHGSSTSSTEDFVRRTAPRHVVFSVGRNRFGFPHAPVLARYSAAGSAVHRTDRDGAIAFRTRGDGVEIFHPR